MVDVRKKLGLILVVMLVVGTFAVNCAWSAEQIRWKVQTAYGTALPALGDQIVSVAENVNVMSGGAIQMKVFEPNALVAPPAITEAVRDNKIPAGYTWLGYDQGRIPASVLIAAGPPFSYDPVEFSAWWYEGGGKGLAEELYAPHNVHPILCGMTGPETGGWYRKELKTIDDFKGMKIRFSGLGGTVLQKTGAAVTMLPGGELFAALEKGAIDATEFSIPPVDVKLGFYKVAKYNYFPGWHQSITTFHLAVNKAVWDKLKPAQQSLVDTACTAGVLKNVARAEALAGPQIIANKTNGVEVRAIPEGILDKLRETSKIVMAEQSAMDSSFKKIYESQQSFDNMYKEYSKIGYLPR